MSRAAFLIGIVVILLGTEQTNAGPLLGARTGDLREVNKQIGGWVHDFTANHGADRRICSHALGEKRDLYVYTPPGYDPSRPWPVMIWLHSFLHDEGHFLQVIPYFDRAICCGLFPPFVIAAPDGSLYGHPTLFGSGGFYINSDRGRYEDFIIQEIWPFVRTHFSIRPDRESHVLAGASMGGFGAFNLGIKYRHEFAHVVGVFPHLNTRYLDCRGRYFDDFDPECFALRERGFYCAPMARFGPLVLRQWQVIKPLFHKGTDLLAKISSENPLEMLYTYDVRPGELNMFAGYGTRDQFNADAQVDSFTYFARSRGLDVTVCRIPDGKHNMDTAVAMFPFIVAWLNPLVPR